MSDIEKELSKYGLDKESYELCLKDVADKINGINDMDWSEIVSKYNIKCHGDTLRKASQTIFGGKFVSEYMQEKNDDNKCHPGYLTSLQVEKIELQKERKKLSDEKLEFNRWLRELSRDELICEKINDEIRNLKALPLPEPIINKTNQRVGILCFADTHYGTEFCINGLNNQVLNQYNPEIFEARMEDLLGQAIQKVQKEGFTTIKVYSLGDEIDGILRASQLMKLRYGVVESTIKYADYICRWLTRLSQHVNVEFQMAEGNHSELRMISQPKGTFKDDNMSKVIREFIRVRMDDNPNFKLIHHPHNLINDDIFGFNILGIHGEVKSLEKAVSVFDNTYHTRIDILIGGHTHHSYSETIGVNRDVITIPSVMGLDDFAVSIGRTCNAGATFLIIEEGKGIVEQTMFKFSI